MRASCLVCASESLVQILDLGMHPFADRFIPLDRAHEPDVFYPLVVDRCASCGNVQLRTETDPEDRYAEGYSYTMAHQKAFWSEWARDVAAKVAPPMGGLVVEAGSNDGTLLGAFKSMGLRTAGVDPSIEMCNLAIEKGVRTIDCHRFDAESAGFIRQAEGLADLVIANNVLNHAESPREFVQAAAELLAPGGTFVFQVPYWPATVAARTFDQVYLEHVSYFSLGTLVYLLGQYDLRVDAFDFVPQHGTSLRIFAKRGAGNPCGGAAATIAAEAKVVMSTPGEVRTKRRDALQTILEMSHRGPIVCAGASAKGNTFLNHIGLDHGLVECVTDVSPLKIGKLTPGSRIPIVAEEELRRYAEPYVIVTTMRETIEKNVLRVNPRAVIVEV